MSSPLLGNVRVQSRVIAALDSERAHHCYLFEGPSGVGKATFAFWLARYANCAAPTRPCDQCPSCRQMLAGSHPDLLIVGPDPSKATRVISIDQAHRTIEAIQLQRHSARRRFVIIDPADALNEESANALLKTLEEPPQGTQFILVSARAASLLQTIRSRSQRVRFGPVPGAELRGWLAARGLDPELAVMSGGSPGQALKLSQGEGESRRKLRDALVSAVGQPLHKAFALAEAEGKKEGGVNRAELVLDVFEELLRDTALVASGREGLVHPELRAHYEDWARILWPGGLGRMWGHVASARERLALNVNGRTVLEALLAQMNLEAR
ncbi:MAG: DNA polymerase III subunit delta' [Deltaproteobacteria bacterium]|nr:DNA polymerase III subunit delta' [Deltaproteobacteria bacterium]